MEKPIRDDTLVDHFAELLAEGATVREAARRLNIHEITGHRWLRAIRNGLGEQAR